VVALRTIMAIFFYLKNNLSKGINGSSMTIPVKSEKGDFIKICLMMGAEVTHSAHLTSCCRSPQSFRAQTSNALSPLYPARILKQTKYSCPLISMYILQSIFKMSWKPM